MAFGHTPLPFSDPPPQASSQASPPVGDLPVLSESARRSLALAAGALRSATAASESRRDPASASVRASAGALQQAVCDCVRELMAADESPERVLIAVKRAALDAGVPERNGVSGSALMDRIVRWCIEAYYRDA